MTIKPIKTQKDYQAALKEIENLWNAKKGTKKADKLEVLATLVEAYENEKYPILSPNPIDAIKFRMEQMGLKNQDLAIYMGGKNRVSEILRGKRKLTVEMIRNLHKHLKIPAESLIAS